MTIKDRWTGKVLWEGECDNIRKEVEAAAQKRADLRGAVLTGADLRGADLTGADLRGAYLADAYLTGAVLRGADLTDADLTGAVLRGAVLRGAVLTGAYLTGAYLAGAVLRGAVLRGAVLAGAVLRGAVLRGADLTDADLTGADLRGADLRGADLTGAVLRGAVLRGAVLTGATGIAPERCTPLLMLLDQPGPIRAYKLVTDDWTGPTYPGITYTIGETVEVAGADCDAANHCVAGINVATLDWCLRDWRPGWHIIVVEFGPEDIAAIPTATDGKFRLHRCRVVGEKDLTGLVPAKEAAPDA